MSSNEETFNLGHLLVSEREQIAVVPINRREALNTLSVSTILELTDVFAQFNENPRIKVIIVYGSGGEAFIAGADLREVGELYGVSAIEFAHRGQRLLNLIERGPQVVIAAIDGYCLGGGLDLALACHIRYASARSEFAHPGARLGIITGFGGTARLPRLLGRARALEIFLTGQRLSAWRALEIGLVDKVITEGTVLDAAIETATSLRLRPFQI
jgi:enoyl-CoA hydratase